MQVASRVLTGEENKLRMADGGWQMADGGGKSRQVMPFVIIPSRS